MKKALTQADDANDYAMSDREISDHDDSDEVRRAEHDDTRKSFTHAFVLKQLMLLAGNLTLQITAPMSPKDKRIVRLVVVEKPLVEELTKKESAVASVPSKTTTTQLRKTRKKPQTQSQIRASRLKRRQQLFSCTHCTKTVQWFGAKIAPKQKFGANDCNQTSAANREQWWGMRMHAVLKLSIDRNALA